MLYIKDIDQPESAEFRKMVWIYWQEIMPHAHEIQDEKRRENYFQARFVQLQAETFLQWIMKDDRPIGFMHFDILQKQNSALIHDFFILPEARRQGLGAAAINSFFEQVDKHHVEMIELNVRRDNPAALAFWESQGFGIASYRLRQYRDPETGEALSGSLSSDS